MRIFDKIQEKEQNGRESQQRDGAVFKGLWSRNTIYVRLLVLILIFSALPCVLIELWANYYIKNVVLNHYMEEYLDGVYESIQNGLNHYIDQLAAYSVYVFSDGAIYGISDSRELSNEEKEQKIRDYLNGYWNNCELAENIDIVTDDGFTIRKKPERITGVPKEFSDSLKHTNIRLFDEVVENDKGEKYLVFGRNVFNMTKNRMMFKLYIYVPEEKIYGALAEVNNNGNLFFLAANDKVISHPDKSNIGKYMMLPEETKHTSADRELFYDYSPLRLKAVTDAAWFVESRMSYSWLYKTTENLQRETMIIVFFAVCLSLLFAIIIPISLLRSVSDLKKRMRVFVSNSLHDRKLQGFSYREIAELEQSFSGMAEEINELIERNNIEKEKQRRAELSALQAQINPHFIYNALDAIAWYAKIEKQSYLADMVYELATFFRISLHKGENIIKVSEEISHVESYIAIEQMRFPGVFEVEYKIQEDLLDEKMIKIILQPIVENSIKHGFDNMDSGGKINITGYKNENGDIIFEIEDNGHGMDFNPLYVEKSKRGYGIRNVNERIRLEYGEEYGLSYNSIPGEGTIVKVKLKKID